MPTRLAWSCLPLSLARAHKAQCAETAIAQGRALGVCLLQKPLPKRSMPGTRRAKVTSARQAWPRHANRSCRLERLDWQTRKPAPPLACLGRASGMDPSLQCDGSTRANSGMHILSEHPSFSLLATISYQQPAPHMLHVRTLVDKVCRLSERNSRQWLPGCPAKGSQACHDPAQDRFKFVYTTVRWRRCLQNPEIVPLAAAYDPGSTRACNLWFRRPTPYPLGHRTFA